MTSQFALGCEQSVAEPERGLVDRRLRLAELHQHLQRMPHLPGGVMSPITGSQEKEESGLQSQNLVHYLFC